MSRKMEIILVSGFLGAGKTTLIRHLLSSHTGEIGKVAVIVNEFGEVGIDGALLSGRGVEMVELTSGCVCCTIKADFFTAIQEIHDRVRPDYLVVEATGVAQPGDILDTLFEPTLREFSHPKSLVTVVDVDFFKVRELLGPFFDNQIRCADILILNKVDLVGAATVGQVEATLRELNPRGRIIPTQYASVDPSLLFGGYPADREGHPPVPRKGEDHEGLTFQTFSFEDDRPMQRGRLIQFLDSLPPTVFRCKGWVRFPDASAFVDFTGGRYRTEPHDNPRATALTFVGRNCSETEILAALRECLIEEPTEP